MHYAKMALSEKDGGADRLPEHHSRGEGEPRKMDGRKASVRLLFFAVMMWLCWPMLNSSERKSERAAAAVQRKWAARDLCPQHAPFTHSVPPPASLQEPSRQELAHRLSGAVQVDTSGGDEWPTVAEDPERWERVFRPFQHYLEETFPALHAPDSKVKRTLVNEHGLLYEWQGADASLKPLMLMAHQDVVPVEPTTADQWTYPPFSGHYDEERGIVWGRGASDTKASIISILSATQSLLEADFAPNRTLVISFGFDEESSGTQGALALSQHIEAKYGARGIAMIVDEGGSVYPGTDKRPATAGPAVREKGYLDVSVKIKTPGGHSSMPKPHTSIGYLSSIIVALEKNPPEPVLRTDNPAWNELLCAVQTGNAAPHLRRAIYDVLELQERLAATTCKRRHAAANKRLEKAKREVIRHLDERQLVAFTTTQAVDLIKGGVKVNALPEEATAIVNHRIEPGTAVQKLRERIAGVVGPVAREMGLNVDGFGQEKLSVTVKEPKGTVVLSDAFQSGLEPSPATPLDGEAAKPWRMLSGVIRETWDGPADARAEKKDGERLLVVPLLMGGNTDTSRTWNLTEHIFRFSPGTTKPEPADLGAKTPFGGIHTVDERAQDDTLVQGWRFYTRLIRASSEVEL